jgi:hypothetical protein
MQLRRLRAVSGRVVPLRLLPSQPRPRLPLALRPHQLYWLRGVRSHGAVPCHLAEVLPEAAAAGARDGVAAGGDAGRGAAELGDVSAAWG